MGRTWSVECGIWNMECRVWNMEYRILNIEYAKAPCFTKTLLAFVGD